VNALKTELQWFGSRANLRKLSSADLTLSVGKDVIQPVKVARDLSDYVDDDYDGDHDWVITRQVCLRPGEHVNESEIKLK